MGVVAIGKWLRGRVGRGMHGVIDTKYRFVEGTDRTNRFLMKNLRIFPPVFWGTQIKYYAGRDP